MNDQVSGQEERLLKAADVARKLNISKAQAYRLIRSGEIAVVRIGHSVRVLPFDLARFVERSRQEETAA